MFRKVVGAFSGAGRLAAFTGVRTGYATARTLARSAARPAKLTSFSVYPKNAQPARWGPGLGPATPASGYQVSSARCRTYLTPNALMLCARSHGRIFTGAWRRSLGAHVSLRASERATNGTDEGESSFTWWLDAAAFFVLYFAVSLGVVLTPSLPPQRAPSVATRFSARSGTWLANTSFTFRV